MKPHGHFFAKNKFSEASRLPYGRFFLFGVIRIITCAGVKPHGQFFSLRVLQECEAAQAIFFFLGLRINSQRRVASRTGVFLLLGIKK